MSKKGFVHCDLKLENIMINFDEDGKPSAKVIDFGSSFEAQKGLPKVVFSLQFRLLPPNICLPSCWPHLNLPLRPIVLKKWMSGRLAAFSYRYSLASLCGSAINANYKSNRSTKFNLEYLHSLIESIPKS